MDGSKYNRSKRCCFVEDVEHQQEKIENDGIRENEGVSSPMSKTRLKQGIEVK